MSRFCRVLAWCTAVVIVATPARSSAEPIPIMAGSLDMVGLSGTLWLEGERGFSFVGPTSAVFGVLGPRMSCLPCPPGTPISLASHWSGIDLRGTATLDGVTYERVGSLASGHAVGAVDFFGSAGVAPPLEGTVASLVAPFLFRGQFFFPTPGEVTGFNESLFGWGTATVLLTRPGDLPFWQYSSVVYEFDPVPEPATLVLVGTALGGLALGRRMKRKGRRA